ncbi:serine hydrolase domain-containing protein [Actinospongicola halichondriae]|uniref:serine hydrolase domain-containing protein n=1 Tax=Actinospongicola halichondriae TaxID=3236844 RepID=UPI003D525B6D
MLQGHVHPSFGAVTHLLDRYTSGPKRYGGAVCVYFQGEKVVDAWGGARDPSGTPWDEDTMSISWSTTKGVTSTALHVLADRGLVDYDEPVATYWPEFAQADKGRVTIRQLVSHQAGLHRLAGVVDHGDDLLDWDRMTSALAAQPSDPPAGTGSGYHAMSYGWLVGEVVRRVSGKGLGQFVQDELAEPLGLDGLHIGLPDEDRHRVAPLMPPYKAVSPRAEAAVTGFLLRHGPFRRLVETSAVPGMMDLFRDVSLRVLDAEIGAANGTFTARSLARLYAAIANDGEHDGVRILSPGRVALMSEQQTFGRDYCVPIKMRWRLGYHRAFTASLRQPERAFGHFGLGGSGAWADPETNLSVAYVTNDMRSATTPFGDARLARIGAAAMKAARSA